MNKKASDLVKYITAIVLIIVSAIIIIFFWTNLKVEENATKDACLASVELRDIKLLLMEASDFIPLNCKTEKICLTKSGENCKAIGFKPSKTNEITKIKIGLLSTTKQKAIETLSNSLYDCHKMLGQGELNFMPKEWSAKNYCLICSHIALDTEAREELKEVSYFELYQYLQIKINSEGNSYLKSIYGVDNANEMLTALQQATDQINNKKGEKIKPGDLKIQFGEQGNVVLAQISTQSTWETYLTYGGGTAGGSLAVIGVLLAPFTAGASLSLTVWGTSGAVVSIAAGEISEEITSETDLEENQEYSVYPLILKKIPGRDAIYAAPSIYPYDIKILKGLDCNEFALAP